MILVQQPTDPELEVVNFFSGVGGCALGLKWAGFTGVGAFDLDPKALRGLARNTGWPTFLCDVAKLSPADVRAWVKRCPRLVVMSPPCKRFSDLLPPEQAAAAEYVEMAQLALAGVVLACEAWAPELPPILILENVRGILGPRGAEILAQIVKLLHRYGYSVDVSTHDCGEYGGLAQHRDRVLIVARQPEVAPDWLRKPPIQRVRNVGESLSAQDLFLELRQITIAENCRCIRLATRGDEVNDVVSQMQAARSCIRKIGVMEGADLGDKELDRWFDAIGQRGFEYMKALLVTLNGPALLHPAGRCACGGGGGGDCECVMDRRRSLREDRWERRTAASNVERKREVRRAKQARKARRGW